MIHLNGFPCLEKEDHRHGVAVGAVMTGRTEGVKLANEPDQVDFSVRPPFPSSTALALPRQLPLHQLKTILGSERNGRTKGFSGWPVVVDANDLSILGYVSSADLTKTINDATLTRFSEDVMVVLSRKSGRKRDQGEEDKEEQEEEGESSAGEESEGGRGMFERLDLSYLVNPTPVRVSPKQPLEMVVSLFKQIGPRMILIEARGRLVGLITLKDLLRFEARGSSVGSHGRRRRPADEDDDDDDQDGDGDSEEDEGDLQELLEDAKDLWWATKRLFLRWLKGPSSHYVPAARAGSPSLSTNYPP